MTGARRRPTVPMTRSISHWQIGCCGQRNWMSGQAEPCVLLAGACGGLLDQTGVCAEQVLVGLAQHLGGQLAAQAPAQIRGRCEAQHPGLVVDTVALGLRNPADGVLGEAVDTREKAVGLRGDRDRDRGRRLHPAAPVPKRVASQSSSSSGAVACSMHSRSNCSVFKSYRSSWLQGEPGKPWCHALAPETLPRPTASSCSSISAGLCSRPRVKRGARAPAGRSADG